MNIINISELQSLIRPSLSPFTEPREGLADVISMDEMLTNQILPFHFKTVAAQYM